MWYDVVWHDVKFVQDAVDTAAVRGSFVEVSWKLQGVPLFDHGMGMGDKISTRYTRKARDYFWCGFSGARPNSTIASNIDIPANGNSMAKATPRLMCLTCLPRVFVATATATALTLK